MMWTMMTTMMMVVIIVGVITAIRRVKIIFITVMFIINGPLF